MELNGNVFAYQGDVFNRIEADLAELFRQAEEAAQRCDSQIGMFGVFPSVTEEHLNPDTYMTELHRYNLLNKQLLSMRGRPVHLHLDGEERLDVEKHDVMLEALATSLQVHTQVPFDEIVPTYHAGLWSSMLMLAATANSPLVLGKCCWQESRIGIFKQSVDTRNPQEKQDHIVPRVHFGKRYIDSLLDLFEDNLHYYTPLLPEVLDRPIEDLHHLALHNGTIWRWVRPIIARNKDGSHHLRLELRVVPSGPTLADTLANTVFYVGLTEGLKTLGEQLTEAALRNAGSRLLPRRARRPRFAGALARRRPTVRSGSCCWNARCRWRARRSPTPASSRLRALARHHRGPGRERRHRRRLDFAPLEAARRQRPAGLRLHRAGQDQPTRAYSGRTPQHDRTV